MWWVFNISCLNTEINNHWTVRSGNVFFFSFELYRELLQSQCYCTYHIMSIYPVLTSWEHSKFCPENDQTGRSYRYGLFTSHVESRLFNENVIVKTAQALPSCEWCKNVVVQTNELGGSGLNTTNSRKHCRCCLKHSTKKLQPQVLVRNFCSLCYSLMRRTLQPTH